MRTAALAWAAMLGLTAACSGDPARTSAAPVPSTVVSPPPGEVRQGLPTVPDDDRRSIPRVGADDATPPQLTTRTTVLAGNRPALVVTLPEAVLFSFGSAELRPDAEVPLHQVLDLLRRPGAHAEVGGHTDSVGSADYNHQLSRQRAMAVVDWLVSHDVPRSHLHPVGYGATRPVAGNVTDDDRRRNRRVELTVRDA